MTEGEGRDWLGAAVTALEHIPLDLLAKGCKSAKLTCTHHGQIVPAIVEATREDLAWRNRPKSGPVAFLPPPRFDQEKVDPNKISTDLQRFGLAAGWIVEIAPAGEGIPAIYAWAEDVA